MSLVDFFFFIKDISVIMQLSVMINMCCTECGKEGCWQSWKFVLYS